jgi:hypothetical protein
VPVKQPFSLLDLIQPKYNNGILVNASEDWKPLQLLLLTKALIGYLTPEYILFHR